MLNSLKKVLLGSFLLSVILTGCGTNNNLVNNPDNLALNTVDENSDISASSAKYKITDIIGIGDVYTKKLNDQKIKYAVDLIPFVAKRSDRNKFAEKTGISPKLLLTWANNVDLMSLKGIGPRNAKFLTSIGVDSVKELSQRNIDNLYERLGIANTFGTPFVKQMPSKNQVKAWLDTSKSTKLTVEQ
ncbi:MAG: DUF4332 domain-containing protein [Candidatus Sericytochromatia bacterium]|nr:DUF4332 domain-containing protein [Candidatus Sericytochromatia bacterium]